MLIDRNLYLWAKSAPQTLTPETGEQSWEFSAPLLIYLLEGNAQVSVYEDAEKANLLYEGLLPWEPTNPICCDGLYLVTDTLSELTLICEAGTRKIDFSPYMNTKSGMTAITTSYNDDSTYTASGMSSFKFNGTAVGTLYISSNHWIGFGTSSEQLKVCRRDGCSTAIYRQAGAFADGTTFIKIRFEGYTVYSNRVTANRLIFELFLLSNNDMFLNMVQTPTNSSYTGVSSLTASTTTTLTLHDGSGSGPVVSFYHLDSTGKTWDIRYEDYQQPNNYTDGYLLQLEDGYYTLSDDGTAVAVDVSNLTAAMFIKYGFDAIPSEALLLTLQNPKLLYWRSDDSRTQFRARVTAEPKPQTIRAAADMSHHSILGITEMTAQYSGAVKVRASIDGGVTFSDEVDLGDYLNTDLTVLWESVQETHRLDLEFILYEGATLTSFILQYLN